MGKIGQKWKIYMNLNKIYGEKHEKVDDERKIKDKNNRLKKKDKE